jgi:CRP-like cAMP-binding protein
LPRRDPGFSKMLASESRGLTLASLDENAILRHVNGDEAKRILETGELVDMPARYVIYRAGEPIHEVFFPIDCVLSVVTRTKDGEEIEVGPSAARERRASHCSWAA